MRDHNFEPGPKRGENTWDEFLKIHAQTLWQCDFFGKKVLTLSGVREFFVLAFIHVGTRRVYVTPATANPTEEWCRARAIDFVHHATCAGLKAEFVFHDRDSKFGKAFDGELARHGIKGDRVAYRAPNLNAFIERWVQSIEVECLDDFLVFGERHLNYLVAEYVRHFLLHRPHQSLGNAPLVELPAPPEDVPRRADVRCEKALGGLLKHYHRVAA
jgi:putative transposase